jgi:hypothetical protein
MKKIIILALSVLISTPFTITAPRAACTFVTDPCKTPCDTPICTNECDDLRECICLLQEQIHELQKQMAEIICTLNQLKNDR